MKIIDGTIASPLGFSADGLHAGFKKKKLDFGWIVSEVPASVAGVYTTNKVIAAPLLVTKASIQKSQKLQAIVVNSGVANSCTGQQGLDVLRSVFGGKFEARKRLYHIALRDLKLLEK